nr:vomeronasal type-2 receptor 116-like [Meriones unguiculatus]
MFSLIFILWLLQIPSLACAFNNNQCYYLIREDFHREGDVVIGAFFPVHTYYIIQEIPHSHLIGYYEDYYLQYNFKNYQFVLAMVFAIEEINGNPNLLPNISIGFDFYNVRFTEKDTLMNACMWLTAHSQSYILPNYNCKKRNCIAALTGTSWTTSAYIGTLLQLFKFPQLSFGPYDPSLSDRGQYSSLYQMAPKDTFLSLGIVSLLTHFSWSWVGLILPDDHKGNKILSDFRDEMERKRICTAFVKMIPTTWTLYFNKRWKFIDEIQESSANVIIIHGDIDSLQGLMRSIGQNLLTWKVWIMNFEQDVTSHADYFMLDSFHGSLIFTHHYRETFEFMNLFQLNSFLRDIHVRDNMSLYWREKLNEEYNIFNLWNFPKGLGLKKKIGTFSANAPQGKQLSLSEHMIQWPEIFSEIPKSVCSESCGPGFRKATLEGKAVCCYNCTPCAENEISNETDVDQCVKCPESHYANTEKNQCLQKAVSFLAYEDPLGIALTSIALCFSAVTVIVIGVFVKHRDTPIVKANNRALSYILLITLTFCFLCSLNFIGRPNTATCILQQTTFGVAFTVALATVLAKAITVVIAFKATFPGRIVRWLMVSRAPNYIIPLCTLIQLVHCGIWMATSPPFIDHDDHIEHEHIIILCNKGSALAFHCVLGYHCFLAFGSYTMAFLSRNLPDSFNESKFLSFSMLVFFCVWVTFLPVYHSTKGKVMVAMEVFAIMASSAALLGFIFAPKCYIILLRPEKNSLQHIRDKIHSKKIISLTKHSSNKYLL